MKNIFMKEEIRRKRDRWGDLTDEAYTVKTLNKPVVVGAAIISFILLILIIGCFGSVPTGHTGVVTTFGRVENYVLDSGIHLKAPWQRVIKMDNRVQKETVDLSCFSSDIQEVSMVYTVNYQISKQYAMTIYSTIGKDFYNNVIVPNVTEAVKVASAQYTAEDLVNMRSELAKKIEEDLAARLLTYNIELVSTSIEDMDFTDAFTNAVEAKQVAAQNKLKAETEAAQKIVEAEAAAQIKKVQTEAEAEAKKIAADADAYEISVRADAEAEANKKLSSSLTSDLIDYKYAESWNGKLPTYMGGDETIPVLNFGE